MDPDSFIREKGIVAFQKLLKDSLPLLDFKLGKLCEEYDIQTDRGKLTVSRQMLQTISQIESAVLRDSYAKKLARRLGVSEAAVWEDYRKSTAKKMKAKPLPPSSRQLDKFEVRLLKFIIKNDKILNLISDELDPADFNLPLRPIAETLLELHRQGKTHLSRNLISALPEEESKRLVSRWLIEPFSRQPSPREISDLLIGIGKRGRREKINKLREEIARANREGKEITHFQRECMRLRRELDQLPDRIRRKLDR